MLRSQFPVGLLLLGTLWLGSLWAQGAGAAVQPPGATPTSQPSATSPAPHSVDARALGMTEAMLDYCAKNDPSGGAKVKARLKQLVQGASQQALAQARKSTEYHSAHDSEVGFIDKIDPRNAPRLCSGSVARKK
jgi:hypothetical protein